MKVGDLVEWVKYEPMNYAQRHNSSKSYNPTFGQFGDIAIGIVVDTDINTKSSGFYVKIMYEDGKYTYAWSNTVKVIQE